MRRLIGIWALLLALIWLGSQCVARSQVPQLDLLLWQTKKQTVGSSCVFDGSVNGNTPSTTSVTVTLTVTNQNDVFVLEIEDNGTISNGTISDTAGLTWTRRAATVNDKIAHYYALAGSHTSDAITFSEATSTYLELTAFGVNGANLSAVWDTNGSLPATSTGTSITVSTSNAHDFVFAESRSGGPNPFPNPITWTNFATGSFLFSEYLISTGTLSSVGITDANSNGMIGDAIQCAH